MSTYKCPVCGEVFESFGDADRHYDLHKPSTYILESWEIGSEGLEE